MHHRLLTAVTSLGLVVLFAGCGNGDPNAIGAARAAAGNAGGGGVGSIVAAATTGDTTVQLKEMRFAPTSATVATGQTVLWKNVDTIPHNVTFGSDPSLSSKTLSGGDSFAVKFLQPGTYHYTCTFHPGMDATITVTGAAVAGGASAAGAAGSAAPPSMSAEGMDAAMASSIKAFPAKTEGLGAQPLTATVLPNGTKHFELTAAVTQWEVSPGKKVDAWTYNGTVPGPMIKVAVGDRVEVVLHNKLPESTTIHFHGVRAANDQDGTPFITQDPVKPGADHTYAFTATLAMTGMYHSHDDAIKQMPNGLFGPIMIGDVKIPDGMTVTGGNQPMILDDAGTVGLTLNGKSFPATAPFSAKLGDWLEVTYFNAGGMDHPMHLHEFPQLVVAKDGYSLAAPYYADTVLVGPGERYTVLIHADLPGAWVWHCHILSHAENDQGMFGMVTALVVK